MIHNAESQHKRLNSHHGHFDINARLEWLGITAACILQLCQI